MPESTVRFFYDLFAKLINANFVKTAGCFISAVTLGVLTSQLVIEP